jgi:hypothetical protein
MGNAVTMQIVFVLEQPFHVAPYIAEVVVGHKGFAYQTRDTGGCGSARICQLAGEFLVASVRERGVVREDILPRDQALHTLRSMLEGKADNIVGETKVVLSRTGVFAYDLLRKQHFYSSILLSCIPGTLHKNILEKWGKFERAAPLRNYIGSRSLFVYCDNIRGINKRQRSFDGGVIITNLLRPA